MPNQTTPYLSKAWYISYCSTIRSHPDDLRYRVTACCTLNNSTCRVGEVYPVGRLFDKDRTSCVIFSNYWNRQRYSDNESAFIKLHNQTSIIQGAWRVTWTKFHIEDPQTLGTTTQNSVAQATGHPGFVAPWFKTGLSTQENNNVRKLKTVVFWFLTPCDIVGGYWSFRGTYCLYIQASRTKFKFDTKEMSTMMQLGYT